jgi:LytR cell envelope-related transcriptional attenuator
VEVSEIFDTVTGFVALAAALGGVLLIPLYLSQRRDVRRLREWIDREPDYAGVDLAHSETRLDDAESELERVLVQTTATGDEQATEVRPPGTGETPISAATRVTHERPALERITMERAALAPHPRWRRFVSSATQPRVLVAIGAVALLLGAGAIFASQQLLSDDEGPSGPHVGRVNPADVTVAVLNGTSVNGLAGKVGSDIEASGYQLGAVTNTSPDYKKTVVMYADKQKPAAQKVAGDIGVTEVDPLDRALRDLVGEADVVVIAGEDRA